MIEKSGDRIIFFASLSLSLFFFHVKLISKLEISPETCSLNVYARYKRIYFAINLSRNNIGSDLDPDLLPYYRLNKRNRYVNYQFARIKSLLVSPSF